MFEGIAFLALLWRLESHASFPEVEWLELRASNPNRAV